MLLLTLGEADLKFDAPGLVVHVQRHQGVAGALHFSDDLVDLGFVQQQFAGTHRVGMDVRGSVEQGADVRAEQIQLTALYRDVRLF